MRGLRRLFSLGLCLLAVILFVKHYWHRSHTDNLEQKKRYIQPQVPVRIQRAEQVSNMKTSASKVEAPSKPLKTKHLLFWNWNWLPDIGFPLETALKRSNCPHHEHCKLTKDRKMASTSDVLFFLSRLGKDAPHAQRRPGQRWIFIEGESPCLGAAVHEGKSGGPFNWTMTFLKDSDIYAPYSEIVPRETPLQKDYMAIARAKTKSVAWMVSDCSGPSRRLDYVRELQKYIDVDIYGSCGPGKYKCPKEKGVIMGYEKKCLSMMEKTYKFYLSFENSIAVDYVTEKFFKTVNIDIVAVVRNGANMTRLGFHKDWYINTADYSSPKELADYLKKLDANDVLYVKYLEWKKYYYMRMSSSLCQLCERLLYHDDPPKSYSSGDIRQYFFANKCSTPKDIVK